MIGRPLMDAVRHHFVAECDDRRALVVGAVSRHIDDPADSAIAADLELRGGKSERPGDRRAIGPAVRHPCNVVGNGGSGCRAIDQPPGQENFLIGDSSPFDIGQRNAAMGAMLEGIEKLAGFERADITLPLQGLLVRIHGIGHVDRQRELDVDIGLLRDSKGAISQPGTDDAQTCE